MPLRPWHVLALVLALSGCRVDSEPTYRVDFAATPAQRAVIAEGFARWTGVTGVVFTEVARPRDNTIRIREGSDLPYLGFARYESVEAWDTRRLRFINVLGAPGITLDRRIWREYGRAAQLRLVVHEIGHIVMHYEHTAACPSTMHPTPVECGTDEIDAFAARRANDTIDSGWLDTVDDGHLLRRAGRLFVHH